MSVDAKSNRTAFLSAIGIGALVTSALVGALVGAVPLYAPPATPHSDGPGSTPELLASAAPPERGDGLTPARVAERSKADGAAAVVAAQRQTIVMAQLRLDQLGCYVGPIDGVWSHNAQASLAALNNALGQKYVVEVPDEDLLKALNDADPRVCRRNGRHATQDPAARHGPANGDHAVTPAVTVDLLPAPPQALQLTQPLSQPQSIAPPGQGEPDRTAAATRSDGEPGGQAATAGKAEINAGKQDVSGSIARGEQRRNAKSGGAAPARSSRKEADVFGTLGGQAH